MPTKYRIKFKDGGERCPKNEKQLKNLPECGIIYDRDNLPFVPDNPPPHHPKFEPINRGFPIGDLTHPIKKPLNPTVPHKPSRARRIAEVVGAGIDDLDTTNPFYIGAGIKKYGIYEPNFLPRDAENITAPNDYFDRYNVNFSQDTPYEGQLDPMQINRTFSETVEALDSAMELADMPAFARDAPVTERIPVVKRQMSVEEAKKLGMNALKDPDVQIAVIEKQLEKLVRPTRPQITRKEMETIKRNLKDVIDPEIVERFIIDNDYIDLEFEEDISKISNIKQRQLMRRLRGMRRGFVRERTQPVSNFNPLDVEFGDELEPYTPLADRTDIRPARRRLQKELQKRAGKLPEPARQVFKAGERFAENLRLKSLEAREQAQIKISKFFRSKYERVPLGEEGFEFQDLGRTPEGISTEIPRELQEERVNVPLEEFPEVR